MGYRRGAVCSSSSASSSSAATLPDPPPAPCRLAAALWAAGATGSGTLAVDGSRILQAMVSGWGRRSLMEGRGAYMLPYWMLGVAVMSTSDVFTAITGMAEPLSYDWCASVTNVHTAAIYEANCDYGRVNRCVMAQNCHSMRSIVQPVALVSCRMQPSCNWILKRLDKLTRLLPPKRIFILAFWNALRVSGERRRL